MGRFVSEPAEERRRRMKLGFILYNGVTQLDFTGPLQFLGRLPGAEVFIIAKETGPLTTDSALTILPTHSFAEAPQMDLICIPGGFGVKAAIEDTETVDFVREQGEAAEYVTSVCTGALLLGAAGLLRGKRATTHWAYTDLLALCGAQYEEARVVQDGNTFTGGGVTAGIDFALTVIAAIRGDGLAQALQLGLEYDPQPSFNTGHPTKAPIDIVARIQPLYTDQVAATAAAINTALAQ